MKRLDYEPRRECHACACGRAPGDRQLGRRRRHSRSVATTVGLFVGSRTGTADEIELVRCEPGLVSCLEHARLAQEEGTDGVAWKSAADDQSR